MARLPIDILTAGNRNELPTGQFTVEKTTAADFGGQVGKAMEGLGDAGIALAAKIGANQKKLQEFGYEDQFVKLQEQDNTEYEERYRGIAGTADGWWQGSRTSTQGRMEAWLKTLPAQAQAEYRVKADRFIAGRSSQAFKDQFNQQDGHTKSIITEEQRKAGLQVQQNPATYDQFVKQQSDLIDKSTLPAAEKAKLKAIAQNSLAYTAEIARAEKDPEGVANRATPVFAPDVNSAIDKAAAASGIDQGMLRRFAQIESSGKPGAVMGSYKGLFQMSEAEFAKWGGGNIWSAEDNANAAARKIKSEMGAFKAKYGRDPTATDLYMQHQQGTAGYAAHLANPNAPAWQNMLSTGEGQSKGETWAKAAIWGNIPNDVKAQFPGGVDTVTSAAFVNVWRRKVDGYASATTASGALTPAQAAAVQETARSQITAQERQRSAQYEAAQTAQRNQLYIDLKEGTAPEATYREARKSGLLSDFADIEKAERIIKTRNDGEEAYTRGLSLMQGGRVTANPYDKTHREGVQTFYDRAVKGGADPAATAAAVFDRTGIMPQSFATAMRGAMISEDPERVKAGLTVASGMLVDNPNAFAGIEGGGELEKNANEFRRLTADLDLGPEAAVKRILADARDPTRLDPVRQEHLQQFKKTSLTQEKIDERLKSKFSPWLGSVELPTGSQRTAIASIYASFATEGYETFRDTEKALAFADLRVEQQMGVQNGVLMRFPPAKAGLPRLAGTGGDGYSWINEQAAAAVKSELNIVVDPSKVFLVPVERPGASTRAAFHGQRATVTREDSGRPDQRTSFQSVPYMIMVQTDTPGKEVVTINKAFFPDIDTYVAEANKAAENDPRPLNYYDANGMAVPMQGYQRKLLETPEQQGRREQAEREAGLREAQTTARGKQVEYQAGARREIQQREEQINVLGERLKDLDRSDNPLTAQSARNIIDGEVMKLKGEILQLRKNADARKLR